MMLVSVGLDPSIVRTERRDTILDYVVDLSVTEARRNCLACGCTEFCERWLAGDEPGGNQFCPNADLFDALKVICDPGVRQ